MRFILSVLIWAIMVGGVYAYTQTRDRQRVSSVKEQPQLTRVTENYTISLTPTFSVERDPFALTSENEDGDGFELWLNGEPVVVDETGLRQGDELRIENVPGLVVGVNEIFIKASPPLSGESENYAVRVKLLQDNTIVEEKTLWASNGALVTGTLTTKLGKEKEENHDH